MIGQPYRATSFAALGDSLLAIWDNTPDAAEHDKAFTALHLLSLMYVAFKIIAPDQSIGFDLDAEYKLAMSMHGATDSGPVD